MHDQFELCRTLQIFTYDDCFFSIVQEETPSRRTWYVEDEAGRRREIPSLDDLKAVRLACSLLASDARSGEAR